MKPAPFTYHAPTRVEEMLGLLDDDEREARVIAGGQSLVPMMNFRLAAPEVLVDLNRVQELRGIRRDADGALTIGAAVRQAAVLRDASIARDWPVLAAGIRHIGHPQIRSRGTVCGSLAHHDPTAELPALAIALDARMTVASSAGRRTIAAEDFFVSFYEVALEPGEVLLEVTFPPMRAQTGWSFQELAQRRGDFAMVGAVVLTDRDANAAAANPRVVLFGVGDRPLRCRAAEEAIAGRTVDDELCQEVKAVVAGAVSPTGDVHASAEYRRDAVAELAARALVEADGRCGDA